MKDKNNIFDKVDNKVDLIDLEHQILKYWLKNDSFKKLQKKNKGNETWSFMDGPITANNPMGVHHAWGRSLKDIYQRYHAMNGKDLRYQNGFDCQGLWVEVEVEKELGFKTKRDILEFGIEKFVDLCKQRVEKYSSIQTEQSKRLGYWMDWDNSYYTMSDDNNYAIWGFLKKLFERDKIYKGSDVVPWSGKSGTSYSQMEIIEGRKLVAHRSVFVRFPIIGKKNEFLLVWTTTPWTLTSNVAVAVNINLEYVKVRSKSKDGAIYYFAKDNLEFKRLDKQFKDKKSWIKDIPKLKTIAQIFNERGGYKVLDTILGKEMLDWKYKGIFDDLEAQSKMGGYPNSNDKLSNLCSIKCHRVIDGGKDSIGKDIVVAGEGTGIVHIAPGCGSIDNKIARNNNLVEIAPLDEESKFISGFGVFVGDLATSPDTITKVIDEITKREYLLYEEKYPHVYPHCWRSGDELVYRIVEEWYINMDWRDEIKDVVKDVEWIPEWGHDREMEWLNNMGDWMISKKRFWGLALPIWTFEDGSFHVVGSKEELKELCVDGWDEFKGHSPHRPWIDKIKIKHPVSGLIGQRIEDVGNPWLDAGIVPFSTLKYFSDKEYWNKWFPADFVVECFPGQFRNWFYSLLAMSVLLENKTPFKTLLGHGLVKDENGRDMHKSWGNAIWFDDAAEKMGVDVMRWLYASQNPEHNLLFGYDLANEARKNLITLWNTYTFFVSYANIDNFVPSINFDFADSPKIDLWIVAKTNEFIYQSDEYYSNFQLYKFMDNAERFLNDISNWYVRRNRRRFWKSENDDNKNSAYQALYYVLIRYIKVIAPIVPFITEKIFQNLAKAQKNKKINSIHHETFPNVELNLYNKKIIKEINDVQSVVNLGRSARNKANIKIRQPLSDIFIFSSKEVATYALNNANDILDELNVKNIKIVDSQKDLIEYNVKLNYKDLGKKYGDKIKKISHAISLFDKEELIMSLQSKKAIQINIKDDLNLTLSRNDFIFDEVSPDGFSVSTSNDLVVGIKTHISEELKLEGLARDIIRLIQNLRKESGLDIEDRIEVSISGLNNFKILSDYHREYIINEVLGVSFSTNVNCHDFIQEAKLSGMNLKIGISKIK